MSLHSSPVGFIGIGNMGLAMALRLRDAGQAVRAHDIDNRRCDQASLAGVQIVGTPAEVATGLSLLIVVVVDAAQCELVLFGPQGAASALPAGATVMLCPTIAPHDVEQLAQRLAAQGLQCIDAPMSGGPLRARDGSMSLMVACSDALWAAHEALLAHLAGRLVRVGTRLGDGARTKLVNNLLAAINLAGAAEAMALAQHLGLDAQRTLAVIGQSSGQSWIGMDRMVRALQDDFTALAHTTLLAKDSGLAMAMAGQAGLNPPMGAQAAALFQDALAAGYGAQDDGRLLSLMQQRFQSR